MYIIFRISNFLSILAVIAYFSACSSSVAIHDNGDRIIEENNIEQVVEDSSSITGTFSLSLQYDSIPQSILEEVEFFAGGGGSNAFLYCVNEQGDIVFDTVTSEPKVESGDVVNTYFYTDKPVIISFLFPDGATMVKQLTAGEYFFGSPEFPFTFLGTEFSYLVTTQSPVGGYTISFDDGVQNQDCFFRVRTISSPQLHPSYIRYVDELSIAIYNATDGNMESAAESLSPTKLAEIKASIPLEYSPRITLVNFMPNEHVCLFAYESSSLVTWQVFQVDNNGYLVINLDVETFIEPSNYSVRKPFFAAIGNKSGEVYSFESNIFARSIIRNMPRYVQVKAQVDNYYIYEGPDMDADVVDKLVTEQRLIVNEKQITFSGELWWNVQTDNGTKGWVSNSILTSESTGSSIACPGTH